jgi:hypothetical protein
MDIISGHRTRVLVAILVAVGATSAFGYWGYGEYRVYELRSEVSELVKDTSERLRESLSVEPNSASARNPETLRKLYDHAVSVDGHYQKLREIDLSPVGAYADAADDYLLTSREILLRRASSQRNQLKLADSLRALRNHMRADDRTGSWVTNAVRAKERVEENYRDYRMTTDALGRLLESFPASQAHIAPHVEASLLIDDALVRQARERLQETSGRTAAEIEKIANLNFYRSAPPVGRRADSSRNRTAR